jgi:hypothetical protein
MMLPDVHCNAYGSAHHLDTSEGDTFGGLGTSREFREEDLWHPDDKIEAALTDLDKVCAA